MKRIFRPITISLAWLCSGLLLAGPPAVKDPAYAEITDDPKLPRVLIIGDNPHFNSKGSQALARQIADRIKVALNSR